jgi:hypothetical protein
LRQSEERLGRLHGAHDRLAEELAAANKLVYESRNEKD